MKRCPRCGSTDTAPLRNYGRPIPGRYTCYSCGPRFKGKWWSEHPGDLEYVDSQTKQRGKICIIAVRIGEEPEVEEMDTGLDAMRKFVDGPIECLPLDAGVHLWCNEEGKLTHSPNRLYISAAGHIDAIHGNFFLASHDGQGETIGLTNEQVETWLPRVKAFPLLWKLEFRDVT